MIKDKRYTLPIAEIKEETTEVRTFCFNVNLDVEAGQFIMLTDFNGGEKPFSISNYESTSDGKLLSVTIKKIGNFTSRLFEMFKGDLVSIRGAYGSSFFIPGKDNSANEEYHCLPKDFKPVLCGGGFGLPPLYLLARHLIDAGVPSSNIRVIAAGRNEEALLFEERFNMLGVSYIGAAENLNNSGHNRFLGTAAEALASFDTDFNFVYASGPDLMMKSLIPFIPNGVEYQFLFERYMKCAIGICGSCATDPSGIRICKEGPALWRTQVEKLQDFGVYKRTASGNIESFTNRLAGKK
ncbi:MAG: hypothetical protein PQJ46_12130 [Spirochaetales bacterium]|nr:hypothetical protein [Spirochaetales bacterium]